jgi:hypothetical protein
VSVVCRDLKDHLVMASQLSFLNTLFTHDAFKKGGCMNAFLNLGDETTACMPEMSCQSPMDTGNLGRTTSAGNDGATMLAAAPSNSEIPASLQDEQEHRSLDAVNQTKHDAQCSGLESDFNTVKSLLEQSRTQAISSQTTPVLARDLSRPFNKNCMSLRQSAKKMQAENPIFSWICKSPLLPKVSGLLEARASFTSLYMVESSSFFVMVVSDQM